MSRQQKRFLQRKNEKLGKKLQRQMKEALTDFGDIPFPNTDGLSFGIKPNPIWVPLDNIVGLQDENVARIHGSTAGMKKRILTSYGVIGFDKTKGIPTLKRKPNSNEFDPFDGYTRTDVLYEIDGVKGTIAWETDTSNISDYERTIYASRMNPEEVPSSPIKKKDVLASAKRLIKDNQMAKNETAVRKFVEELSKPATIGGVNIRPKSWITGCVESIMKENKLGQYKRTIIYTNLGQANKVVKSKNIKNPRGKIPKFIGNKDPKHLKPKGDIVEVKMIGNDPYYIQCMDALATRRSGERRDKYGKGCVTEVYLTLGLEGGKSLKNTRESAINKIKQFVEREKIEKGVTKFCWKIIGFLPQGENETDLIPIYYDPSI